MQNPYESRVYTDFSVYVEVNGAKLTFVGNGGGDAQEGRVDVAVGTKDAVPHGFNPGLLAFAMITGQPDISAMAPGVDNPFQHVHGEYHGIRKLDLGKYGQLTADYRISRIDERNHRTAVFRIAGTTSVPDLVSLEPAFETWVPQGSGSIRGHFTMAWKTRSGEWMKGEIESEYRLPTNRALENVHYRRIEFLIDVGPSSLRQEESITLFTPATAGVPVAVR